MTQIDAYVRRIRFWLPGPRGRVAAEDVRGTLEEILAARAETLGRPLTAEETAAELRAFGRPEVIASRYSPMRPLVSAGLMPAYVRVLGISTAAVIGVQILLMLLAPEPEVGRTLTTAGGRAVTGLLWGFASITLTFAVLTRIYTPSAGAFDPPRC
jgi:hypothetical protein